MIQIKKTGSIINKPESMPEPGPYYTTIVKMNSIKNFPYEYALYFSTDHHSGNGGIWLYLCNGNPTKKENWISYEDAIKDGKFDYLENKPDSNPVYLDNIQGNGHTETPHCNIIEDKVYMTYHRNGTGHSQATLLATSKDGINFDRINGENDSIILNYDITTDPGNGHTGYFRWSQNPFEKIEYKYIGYSLHGGGDQYHSAIWGSNNAIDWSRLEILIPIEGQAVENPEHMIIWHDIDVNSITKINDDEYVAICGVGNRASGIVERIVELYLVFLGADGITLKRSSKKLLSVEKGQPDAEELTSPISILEKDQSQLLYVGAQNGGMLNTVMSATYKLNMNNQMPNELPKEIQQKHFYSLNPIDKKNN